jgi:hypothetical protein
MCAFGNGFDGPDAAQVGVDGPAIAFVSRPTGGLSHLDVQRRYRPVAILASTQNGGRLREVLRPRCLRGTRSDEARSNLFPILCM